MDTEFGLALAIIVAGVVVVAKVGPGRRTSTDVDALDSWFANWSNDGRTVGGRLLRLTDRVRFEPHRVEQGLGQGALELPFDDIASIDVAPRRLGLRALLDGSIRRRLRIRTRDGAEHLFVVNRAVRSAAALEQQRIGASSPVAIR